MSDTPLVTINQNVAILIDGNNIELSLQALTNEKSSFLDFDVVIPRLLDGRGLSRLIYFREGRSISEKLAERLLTQFHGSVMPCHKSADIPLTIRATQIANKVDTIIILSGDSDYVELVRHLKGDGVRVEIAAVERNTAQILIDEADLFTPITGKDSYILKSSRGKPASKPSKSGPSGSDASKSSGKNSNSSGSKSSRSGTAKRSRSTGKKS